MTPYRCPIGRPTITAEGRRLAKKALDEGSLSEGKYVAALEAAFCEMSGARHAIVTSSGHTALVLALRAARNLAGVQAVVTTSVTFISTVTAALQAGLHVECVDVDDDFLAQKDLVDAALERWGGTSMYLPVHLFGNTVETTAGQFVVHDACEALGTVKNGGWVGINPVGCFSFYTSHVLGAGEMGMVAVQSDEFAKHIRQLKDQGRAVLRPTRHIEGETLAFADRYRHDFEGWNYRTSDVHAALIHGNFPSLQEKILRRYANFSSLHRLLQPLSPEVRTLVPRPGASYLAFPIIFKSKGVRDTMVEKLESARIETRPVMSVIPLENAVRYRVTCLSGFVNASQLHERSLYVSCHDQLGESDMEYIAQTITEAL